MASRFRGKTIVVTGGGKGIGRACALAAAAEGGAVVVADRDLAQAEATARRAVDCGGNAFAIDCDVRNPTQVEALFAEVAAKADGTDVLINNAGVIKNGTVVEMSEADWDVMFDVNIKGMFLTCKHAIPQMRGRGGGSIVNLASVSSFASTPKSVAYSATKGAVVTFTRALAVDHAAENIRCNCVAPGSIQTPLLQSAAEYFAPGDPVGAIADWGRSHPLGRVGTPEEVAKLILFLASDDAAFCTGGCYLIDGGLLAPLSAGGAPSGAN
jgi:NAD(P)-dependent dehydrogenase (short-subunit alcohol dehydrogenase family)